MVVSIPLSRARAVYGEYSEPITHTHMHRAYCQLTARIVHYCDEIEGVRVLLCHRGAYHGRSMTPVLFLDRTMPRLDTNTGTKGGVTSVAHFSDTNHSCQALS